jgi:hypothetical protein
VRAFATIALTAVAAIGSAASPARASADGEPVWITGHDGVRFRVRFDPGERVFVGAGAAATAGTAAPAFEVGLVLRSPRPAPGWDVFWKRQHELGRAQLRVPVGGTAAIDGVLYRGLYLRHSREGTLTLPLAPPIAFALPFDIGVLAEVGRVVGPLVLNPGASGLDAGVVHGEVVADFLRSESPGRWLLIGIGGRYHIGVARDEAGVAAVDHRVAPMTALSIALRGERGDGLASAGVRAEGSRRWSSARGWENAFRIDVDAELTPIAVNDRPLSLFAAAIADSGGDASWPELRLVAGIRLAQSLR